MRRLLLVANPAASGFTSQLHRDVVEILNRGYRVTPVWPDGPDQARAAAADAAADGYDVVVGMGGDGVVHQIANGLADSETALGIVPAGTTNVLARLIGVPRKSRAAAEAIAASSDTRPLATMRLTYDGPDGPDSRVVTFAAGLGLDAEVIRESERRPLRKIGFGTLHYARSAAAVTIKGYRGRLPAIRVEAMGRSADAVTLVLQVHEHFTYLGRRALTLAPTGGPLALSMRKVTTSRMIRLVARSARGVDLTGIRGVRVWKGFASITARAEPAEWFEADGELIGRVSTLTATPNHDGLRVVVV
ncbi:MAG TPA: diacylglycerol kinase family protein [Acidimicrobiia bacterium]|nr:diacylglycerol kinase family protein [Acidimicrobiia bacterium]